MKATAINDIGTTAVKTIFVVDGYEYRTAPFPTALAPSIRLDFGQGQGIEWAGNSFFIGQTALDYALKQTIYGRDQGWLTSAHYKAMHLYCVASGINQHIERLKAIRQAYTHLLNQQWEIDLVTAVPFANWANRAEIALNLAGDYSVKLLNDFRVNFTINQETARGKNGNQLVRWPKVMLQAWAAFLRDGEPTPDPDRPNILVFGLGGRNIVYAQMRWNGSVWLPVDGAVGSTEGGILDVADELAKRVMREYRIEINPQQANAALISGRVGDHDISQLTEELKGSYVDSFFSFMNGKWDELRIMPFIERVPLTGGGSVLLGQQIAERHSKIEVSPNGVWAEADGMLKAVT